MAEIPFTGKDCMAALAKADASLRAAGVAGVWLDTAGSGWTQSYVIHIAETQPCMRKVMTVNDPPREVEVPVIRQGAKAAVEAALADLDIGDWLVLDYRAATIPGPQSDRVWPISALVEAIDQQIIRLQAERENLLRRG